MKEQLQSLTVNRAFCKPFQRSTHKNTKLTEFKPKTVPDSFYKESLDVMQVIPLFPDSAYSILSDDASFSVGRATAMQREE